MVGTTGVPGHQYAGHRAAVFQRTAEVLRRQAAIAVGFGEHTARNQYRQVLIGSGGVGDNTGTGGGGHQAEHRLGAAHECFGDATEETRGFHGAAKHHCRDDQPDGAEHTGNAAGAEQVIEHFVTGDNGAVCVERLHDAHIELHVRIGVSGQAAHQVRLENKREHGAEGGTHKDGRQRRYLFDDHTQYRQWHQQQPGGDVDGFLQLVLYLGNIRHGGIRKRAKTEASEEDQCDDDRGRGGDDHVADVGKQLGAGAGRGQVSGVRQGRHLVAKVGTREDRTGRPGGGNTQHVTDTDQRDTDGGGGGPRAAGKHRHHGADDTGRDQEEGRVEHLQAVVDHGGNDAGDHPGTRERADQQQDQDRRGGNAEALDDALLDGLPLDTVAARKAGGDKGTEHQYDLTGAADGVVTVDKEDVNGQQRDQDDQRCGGHQ